MHLYIHVPFCARRCSYCDFAIAVRRDTPSADFRAAVLREWEGWLEAPAWEDSPRMDTIYFGGGTPSRLAPGELATILDRVRRDRPQAEDAEVTLEAHPDDVTPAMASAWAAAGINRVSLGVQSFDPAVLAWMHRTHAAEQVAPAVDALRAAGITNLSLDLIYAVPADLGRDWSRDLERALALAAPHLSLYGLTVEPATPLFHWTRRGEASLAPAERAAEEYLLAQRRFGGAGYTAYEVSNLAKPGFQSRHNSAYWSGAPFLGLGPSAHGGAGDARWWNVRDWAEYLRRSRAGEPVQEGREELAPAARRLERLYLGLRTSQGVSAGLVPAPVAGQWQAEGWAELDSGRLRLTVEGWLRLDALVAAVPDP